METIEKIKLMDNELNVVNFKIVENADIVNGKHNPHYGQIKKITTGKALIVNGDEYEVMRQLVKSRSLKEGLNVTGGRSYIRRYGERDGTHPIVHYKGKLYVNLIVTENYKVEYVNKEGKPLMDYLKCMIKPEKKPKQGDLKNVVYFKKVPIEVLELL